MKKQRESTDDSLIIDVEVAFATPELQKIISLKVQAKTTAREAVNLSGIAGFFPEHNFANSPIGIFGKTVPDNHILNQQNRVEIYRPLHQSPVDARRERVKRVRKDRH